MSCLTTSNLPWFMDLTFQVSMQILFFTALDFTSITSHIYKWAWFLLWPSLFVLSGAISLLFPGSILDTFWLGEVIFWCHIFFLFYTVYGFLRWEYSSGLPFPSPVDHVLSEFSTMTCPFWVVPQSMAHYFIKLHKAMIPMMILVSFLWLWVYFWRLWDCSSCFFCLSSNGWD